MVLVIVVVVVVAVTLLPTILGLALLEAVNGLGTKPGLTPSGTAFAAGNPVASACSTEQVAANARVVTGDRTYRSTVGDSTITFSSIVFEVTEPSGASYGNTGTGSFALVNPSGVVVASSEVRSGGLTMISAGRTTRTVTPRRLRSPASSRS